MSAGGVCVCKSVLSVCLLPEALAEMPRLTGRAKHQSCGASAAVQSRGGRAGGRAGHQLRRGCWEATGQTTSESPRQVTSAPALPLGVLTRGQGTCPPSLARAKTASRRRPKLRRCLVYLKDRSFLPQPFLSPTESLWQDPFPLWHGNSGSCPGSASARRGWRTAGPSRRHVPEARGAGQGVPLTGHDWPPAAGSACAGVTRARPPPVAGPPASSRHCPPEPRDQEGGPWSPGIASDTPQGPTGTADPPADRPQCPTWSLRFVSNSIQHGKHSRA